MEKRTIITISVVALLLVGSILIADSIIKEGDRNKISATLEEKAEKRALFKEECVLMVENNWEKYFTQNCQKRSLIDYDCKYPEEFLKYLESEKVYFTKEEFLKHYYPLQSEEYRDSLINICLKSWLW